MPARPYTSLCLGWLGATERQLQRYGEMHIALGSTRVIQRIAPTYDQFMNHRGLSDIAEEVLSTLQRDHAKVPVIVHCFSNGGAFVLWRLLQLLQADPARFGDVTLRGIIFDSAPATVTRITAARAMTSDIKHPLLRSVAFHAMRLALTGFFAFNARYFGDE
jgi:hypothetical protein